MDVVSALSGYITKMVSAGESSTGTSAAKMKILLLDSETVGNVAFLKLWSGTDWTLGSYRFHCNDSVCVAQP